MYRYNMCRYDSGKTDLWPFILYGCCIVTKNNEILRIEMGYKTFFIILYLLQPREIWGISYFFCETYLTAYHRKVCICITCVVRR